MPEFRAGGYAETPVNRKTLAVVIQGKQDAVFFSPNEGGAFVVPTALGFQNDDVFLNAKRAFADSLYKVSLEMGNRILNEKQKLLKCKAENYETMLKSLLTLDAVDSELALYELRQLGFGLRQNLNAAFVDALKSTNVLHDNPSLRPVVTFHNYQHEPVLWDMMYEGEIGKDVNWEQFWGFMTPLTHWGAKDPAKFRITLKQGLFSAIDQKLIFANSEFDLLTQKLTGFNHHTLGNKFRVRALQGLEQKLSKEAEAWLDDQDEDSWLRRSLEKLNEDEANPKRVELCRIKWKDDAINEIFSDKNFTYELIHFACHCEPNAVSELLSTLKINIAGEDISLSVAAMPAGRRSDTPGPLVFLNACGTGQQGVNAEPPGFPDKWISTRGAMAVIATLCPVPDLFAYAFARKFYNTLFNFKPDPKAPVRERYLAEALLETRRYFMDEYRNPLGLAYVLYAVKDACIEPRN
jgi:hypothetical protein